jgi:uncharacterized protein
MSGLFKQYKSVRDKADKLSGKLEDQHRKHLACKMGCDLCCMEYSILPVEFYSMLETLKQKQFTPELPSVNNSGSCVFLKDHKCTIYNERPVICRTHGLPLLFMGKNDEWELSACELNFNNFDFADFTNENTFPQDRINSELFMANKTFIKEFDEKEFGEFELIPVSKLLNEINTK